METFTARQLNIIQQMIDASIDKKFEDCSFADMSDVEDAVQGAASDARSDIRGVESSIEALEDKVDSLEGRVDGLEND